MALNDVEYSFLTKDPDGFVVSKIEEFVRTSPTNRLDFMANQIIFDEPLVRFADGDDPLFTDYKRIISSEHFTPREALAKAYNKRPEELPEHLTVISYVLPIMTNTRQSNKAETKMPSRLWSHTRWYGEKTNDALRSYLVELLTGEGYLAAAPAIQPYFKILDSERGKYSNWSERHMAFAAGHGTFSLSDGFITERGIAHRCGSVVTNLKVPANVRTAATPFSNCLFYAGVKCKACIERCPAGAITEKGHDKIKCLQYGEPFSHAGKKGPYENTSSIIGCGLCQVGVPCKSRNPAKNIK